MPTTGAYEFKLAAAATNGAIEREDLLKPGEWAWVDRQNEGARRYLAIYICCADCGMIGTLWSKYGDTPARGHDIDTQGNIQPSVGCPSPKGCAFHTRPTKLMGFAERR
jgi:hypothetical protein